MTGVTTELTFQHFCLSIEGQYAGHVAMTVATLPGRPAVMGHLLNVATVARPIVCVLRETNMV